jgi:hypothetical protein
VGKHDREMEEMEEKEQKEYTYKQNLKLFFGTIINGFLSIVSKTVYGRCSVFSPSSISKMDECLSH